MKSFLLVMFFAFFSRACAQETNHVQEVILKKAEVVTFNVTSSASLQISSEQKSQHQIFFNGSSVATVQDSGIVQLKDVGNLEIRSAPTARSAAGKVVYKLVYDDSIVVTANLLTSHFQVGDLIPFAVQVSEQNGSFYNDTTSSWSGNVTVNFKSARSNQLKQVEIALEYSDRILHALIPTDGVLPGEYYLLATVHNSRGVTRSVYAKVILAAKATSPTKAENNASDQEQIFAFDQKMERDGTLIYSVVFWDDFGGRVNPRPFRKEVMAGEIVHVSIDASKVKGQFNYSTSLQFKPSGADTYDVLNAHRGKRYFE